MAIRNASYTRAMELV